MKVSPTTAAETRKDKFVQPLTGPAVIRRACFHFHQCHERQFMTLMADRNPHDDLHAIVDQCTCVGSIRDELALLRAAIRAYANGAGADDAVAYASRLLSDSLTHHSQ